MVLISLGSDYWPRTPEDRALCFLLALYGFTVFGYLTAMLATFFIGRDAHDDSAEVADAAQIAALHEELRQLRQELRTGQFVPPIAPQGVGEVNNTSAQSNL